VKAFAQQPGSDGVTGYAQTIFAEESGSVATTVNSGFQWSFGNGDETPQANGVIAMFTGTLTTLGLETEGGSATIEVYLNGVATGVTTSNGTSDVSLSVNKGDIVNFRTTAGTGTTSGRITALIERGAPVTGVVINPGGTTGQVATLQADGSYSPEDASGGVDADGVVAIAEGLDIIAADAAKAAAGNGGATTSFIPNQLWTGANPNASIVSLDNGNSIFLNDTFVTGLNLGETYEWNASQGDKIVSTFGHSGVSSLVGGNERPVELATAANAGRQFFWFAFRSTPHRHFVQTLALSSRVRVYGPNPNVNADGTSPDTPIQDVTLNAFSVLEFTTPTNGEYYILASQPVVVLTSNSNGGQDQRVLAPLGNRLIGGVAGAGSGDARISALYANTSITVYTSQGVVATGTVSPGSPLSLHGQSGSPINLTKVTNYGDGHAVIVIANAPIAGFAGADAAGTNATTFQLLGAQAQRGGLGYSIRDAGNANVALSFASQYEGTVNIFQNDGTLLATRNLIRRGTLPSPATTPAQQLHPADAAYRSNDADFTTALNRGAYWEANVPVRCVAQFDESNGSVAQQDETDVGGITPEDIRAEFRLDANGLRRRRDIDGTGAETWVEA